MVTLALLAGSCRDDASSADRTARIVYPAAAGPNSYFPTGTHSDNPAADSFMTLWYGQALISMSEPPLYRAQPPDNSIVWRFLWLRSFHPPVAVRLVMSPPHCLVIATSLGPPPQPEHPDTGSYSVYIGDVLRFGPIVRLDSFRVDLDSCQDAVRPLATFWSDASSDSTAGIDGSEWVFEAADRARYHLVTRWTPTSTRWPLYRAAGLAFLRLGAIQPSAQDLY